MAFVMPTKLNSGQVPRPVDSSVTVRDLAAGRFAVLRFSGGRNTKQEAEVAGAIAGVAGEREPEHRRVAGLRLF